MTDLSILCVTKMESHARWFLDDMQTLADALDVELVFGIDGVGRSARKRFRSLFADVTVELQSDGYIESVLDEAIAACSGDYVLRLDDDERASDDLANWLGDGSYHESDHWAFPRRHMWPDKEHFITNPPLWPDLQTRLSVKAKAGGRTQIHQGSPYGTGRVCDAPIEHFKFIVKDRDERERQLQGYRDLIPNADNWAAFSVPELFGDQLHVEHI